ncbi:hypothetical protein FZEAL_4059 [Fusarium zealandicum]|uniref:Uncharacterized protein n=1 Tax=Fusarium zealandicum TaxID=1053134 RepID=A0A8H4UNC8_9HYPO|nr:hypothetical protein FZEAL_4059 [Fusarium zealandicum]
MLTSNYVFGTTGQPQHHLQILAMNLFKLPEFAFHVEELMRQCRVPGLAIAIVQDGLVSSAAYGWALVKDEKPVTADTLFEIGLPFQIIKRRVYRAVGRRRRKPSRDPEMPLNAYIGSYWNPGYHGMEVEIKNNSLFIDATDRSPRLTLTFERESDQTKYIAHLSDYWEGGDDSLAAEFVFRGDRVVKMGLDREPIIGGTIWFGKG